MSVISDWLLSSLSPNEQDEEVVYMNGLNKCVNMRDSQIQSKDVRILGCEDSYIYIDTNVSYLLLDSCVNCTVMVAAVNVACSIEKCEKTTICVASNFLRIGNCVDCTVYSYTQMCPPIIYGDSRNLTMAPHNTSYFDIMTHLREADISFIAPG
jgi:TBCC domain-containing protein 1